MKLCYSSKLFYLSCFVTAVTFVTPARSETPLSAYYTFRSPSIDDSAAPFRDALMPPLADWKGHIFRLNQSYPATAPKEELPWLKIDPNTQSLDYLKAALSYFYEGNIQGAEEDSFDPKLNRVRAWYNAPWQDFGLNGREFIHGLTRERTSTPFELAAEQTHSWSNYAVGFYNAPGGVTIGKIWADHAHPDPSAALMPEGTVAAKLLFTTAPASEVPYLAGAPQWSAYVYADPNNSTPKADSPRKVLVLRLLQIDIAVKDSRITQTGWVFGTFVYGSGPGGNPGSGWNNVAPVGAMWGNDPGFAGSGSLKETVLNPSVKMPHVGYQGRLNGPVDNKMSSCISCHATAEYQAGTMLPPKNTDPSPWFQNYHSGTPFDASRQSLDYSLQISVGLSNFDQYNKIASAPNAMVRKQLIEKLQILEMVPPRNGGGM